MADDERNDDLARWLEVEPLDEVTRRRLVGTALRESEANTAPATAHPSRVWRWVAAAAVIVVVLVVGLALLTAGGGDDTQVATRQSGVVTPKSFDQAVAAAPDVGDFGNLDDAGKLAALRAALRDRERAPAAAPQAAQQATPEGTASDAAGATSEGSGEACLRGIVGTIVAQGTGTLEGRPVVVLLLEGADGKRSVQAVFLDACEGRDLSDSG
jgi:nucleoid-associated protein YgaU